MYRKNLQEENKELSRRNSMRRDEDEAKKQEQSSLIQAGAESTQPAPVVENPRVVNETKTNKDDEKSSGTIEINTKHELSPSETNVEGTSKVADDSLDTPQTSLKADGTENVTSTSDYTAVQIDQKPDDTEEKLAEEEFAKAFDFNAGALEGKNDQFTTDSDKLKEKRDRLKQFRSSAMSIAVDTESGSGLSTARSENQDTNAHNSVKNEDSKSFLSNKDSAKANVKEGDPSGKILSKTPSVSSILSKPLRLKSKNLSRVSTLEEIIPTSASNGKSKLPSASSSKPEDSNSIKSSKTERDAKFLKSDSVEVKADDSAAEVPKDDEILKEVFKKPFSAYDEMFQKANGSNSSSQASSRAQSKPASGTARTIDSADTLRLSDKVKFPSETGSAEGSTPGSRSSGTGKRRPETLAKALKDSFFDDEEDKVKKRKTNLSDVDEIFEGKLSAVKGEDKLAPKRQESFAEESYIDDSTPLLKPIKSGRGLESMPPYLRGSLSNVQKAGSMNQLSPGRGAVSRDSSPMSSPRSRSKFGGARNRGRGRQGASDKKVSGVALGRGGPKRRGRAPNLLDPKAGGLRKSRSRETSRSRDVSPARGKGSAFGDHSGPDRRRANEASAQSRTSGIASAAGAGGGGDDSGSGDEEDDSYIMLDEDIMEEVERQKGRIMPLALKGDWPAIDHALKVLEQARVPSTKYEPYHPLKGMVDEVSFNKIIIKE